MRVQTIMINILICDDNKEFLSQIEKNISNIISDSSFSDFDFKVTAFDNPKSALEFCSLHKVDIAFLDIDMPEIGGFDIAEVIHSKNNDTLIIFVTNFENYVFSSLRYRPLRFIRKSHLDTELNEAMEAALHELVCKNKYLELGNKYSNDKIFFSDILYFESKKNYAEIVCNDGKRYMYRSTLTELENNLKHYDFMRVHAGFLVNMKHINRIFKNTVIMSNNEEISVSKRLSAEVHKTYSEYLRK